VRLRGKQRIGASSEPPYWLLPTSKPNEEDGDATRQNGAAADRNAKSL